MKTSRDPRPLAGYVMLLGAYTAGTTLAVVRLANRRDALGRLDVRRLVLLALATQHLSRLITKDSILAPLRAPFTRFVGPAGQGEANEKVTGTGLRHAVGELVTCPYCVGQWVATGLVAGSVGAPVLTDAVTTVCALARVSDWLQLAHDRVTSDA